MEPHQKRFRSENGGYWSNPTTVSDHQFSNNGGSNLECKRFNTPQGCSFGSNCRFRHASADGRDIVSQGFPSGGKPKPCMKFFSTSGCPFGESCHFMHYIPGGLNSLGLAPIVSFSSTPPIASQRKTVAPTGDPSVTINGYKSKLCNRFNTAEGCRFGDKCHFAHGETDLRLPNNQSQGNFRRAPAERPGMGHSGYSDEDSDFSKMGTIGNTSNFSSQGYGQIIPPGVVASDCSTDYVAGPTGENVQVY